LDIKKIKIYNSNFVWYLCLRPVIKTLTPTIREILNKLLKYQISLYLYEERFKNKIETKQNQLLTKETPLASASNCKLKPGGTTFHKVCISVLKHNHYHFIIITFIISLLLLLSLSPKLLLSSSLSLSSLLFHYFYHCHIK